MVTGNRWGTLFDVLATLYAQYALQYIYIYPAMGTGGILGKKSWHVGTKENRQRVLRDEQAAKEAELQRREGQELRKKERLYELLSSTRTANAPAGTQGMEVDGDAQTRGKAATRTSDPRFDASFRLGGAVGSRVPWYSLGRSDATVRAGGDANDTRGEKNAEVKGKGRPPLLGAAVVGKAKKASKKERRRAQREKMMALRAEREDRERVERERMLADLHS